MTSIGKIRRAAVFSAFVCAGSTIAYPVFAQDYPTRPVRLVVPFGTGGATDSSARAIADRLGHRLGQSVIVENRPGAGGNIGTRTVAQAAPDGYTLLLGLDATLVLNPFTHASVPFDTQRDFAPISKMGDFGLLLVADPKLGLRSLADLIRYARDNPTKVAYSTGGTGSTSHVAGEMLNERAGIKMLHVPYKSGGAALIDAVAGQVQLSFPGIAGATQYVRSGQLIAIGVSSSARNAALPDVPTIAEQGFPGYDAVSWVGILAPTGTPRPIIERLHREIVESLRDPVVVQRFGSLGVRIIGNSPAEFAAEIAAELVSRKKTIETARIRVE
jgi:tripartite-type tricarboxylate transporter receptor subunit TctC